MRSHVLALVAALGVAACSDDPADVPALGTLERDRIELPAEAHEPIVEMKVREGDHVERDQVLMQLDPSDITAQLDSAQAEAGAASHRLAELVHGPRSEDILTARARLAGAEATLDTARKEYERIDELMRQKLVSHTDLDRQRAVRERAAADRNEAKAQLTLLLNGTRIEELDQAREDVKRTEGVLLQLRISAARLTLRAPRAGVVEALPYKLGERPPAGATIAIVLADGDTYARVYTPEQLRSRVAPGTSARVHVDGEAEPFSGRVRFVSSEAAFTPYYALTQRDRGRLSYLTEVTLTEARAARLPAGIPVEVHFELGGQAPQ